MCQDPNAQNFGGALPCRYVTTCQNPAAQNFGGPLPCIITPINVCAVNPGSADCCLANPSHASCGQFNCEQGGGLWTGSSCNYGICGMPPSWEPCRMGGMGGSCSLFQIIPGGYTCVCTGSGIIPYVCP